MQEAEALDSPDQILAKKLLDCKTRLNGSSGEIRANRKQGKGRTQCPPRWANNRKKKEKRRKELHSEHMDEQPGGKHIYERSSAFDILMVDRVALMVLRSI